MERNFQDHRAKDMGSFSNFIIHHHSLEAELLGVMHAIEIVHRKYWFNLWIESDSTTVVNVFLLLLVRW